MTTKIGFNFNDNSTKGQELNVGSIHESTENEATAPRKCLAEIRFPNVYRTYTYYNDTFDLKTGDKVYVSGKLDGVLGTVEGVSYNFKIDLSKYERVIRKIESHIKGEFNLIGVHLLTFDREALPYEKVITWFDFPIRENVDYVVSSDRCSWGLHEIPVGWSSGEHGDWLFAQNQVKYLSLCGTQGVAIVEDNDDIHEIEFAFENSKISDFFCDCYDPYICGHQYAVVRQLQALTTLIEENYAEQYANSNYFALVNRTALETFATDSKASGKVVLE